MCKNYCKSESETINLTHKRLASPCCEWYASAPSTTGRQEKRTLSFVCCLAPIAQQEAIVMSLRRPPSHWQVEIFVCFWISHMSELPEVYFLPMEGRNLSFLLRPFLAPIHTRVTRARNQNTNCNYWTNYWHTYTIRRVRVLRSLTTTYSRTPFSKLLYSRLRSQLMR